MKEERKMVKKFRKTKVEDIVANQIISMIEEGVAPWQKNFIGDVKPVSWVTGKPYTGLNQLLLPPGEYLTFAQIRKQGGRVKKGSESYVAVFYKNIDIEDEIKTEDGKTEVERKTIPMMRYFRLFEVSQTEGIDRKHMSQEDIDLIKKNQTVPMTMEGEEKAKAIMNTFKYAPELKHSNKGRAYYSPSRDYIHLPLKENFVTLESYYSTFFHELAHSTGHPQRLNRFENTVADFGSSGYGEEELIAEFSASMLAGYCGFYEKVAENSASYIDNWRHAISTNPKVLTKGASQARRVVDYIIRNSDFGEIPETSNEVGKLEDDIYRELQGAYFKTMKKLDRTFKQALRERGTLDDELNYFVFKYVTHDIDIRNITINNTRLAEIIEGVQEVDVDIESVEEMVERSKERKEEDLVKYTTQLLNEIKRVEKQEMLLRQIMQGRNVLKSKHFYLMDRGNNDEIKRDVKYRRMVLVTQADKFIREIKRYTESKTGRDGLKTVSSEAFPKYFTTVYLEGWKKTQENKEEEKARPKSKGEVVREKRMVEYFTRLNELKKESGKDLGSFIVMSDGKACKGQKTLKKFDNGYYMVFTVPELNDMVMIGVRHHIYNGEIVHVQSKTSGLSAHMKLFQENQRKIPKGLLKEIVEVSTMVFDLRRKI